MRNSSCRAARTGTITSHKTNCWQSLWQKAVAHLVRGPASIGTGDIALMKKGGKKRLHKRIWVAALLGNLMDLVLCSLTAVYIVALGFIIGNAPPYSARFLVSLLPFVVVGVIYPKLKRIVFMSSGLMTSDEVDILMSRRKWGSPYPEFFYEDRKEEGEETAGSNIPRPNRSSWRILRVQWVVDVCGFLAMTSIILAMCYFAGANDPFFGLRFVLRSFLIVVVALIHLGIRRQVRRKCEHCP